MKKITLPNVTLLFGLLLMAISVTAQESPAHEKQLNKNRIGQPGESHAVHQQKIKPAPVEWVEQQNREKLNRSETRLRQPIPGQNLRQKSGAPNAIPVRTENQKQKTGAMQNFKMLNENLQPANTIALTRTESPGNKDDCNDAWIIMDSEVELICHEWGEWWYSSICPGADFFVDAGEYEYVEWTTSGDGNFWDQGDPFSCYEPGWDDLYFGYVQLCLTAYATAPCQDAFACIDIYITPAPLLEMDSDYSVCYDEVEDPCIELGEEVWVWAEFYSGVYWYSYGDGYIEEPWNLYTCYYPGINDILNGGFEIEIYLEPIYPCTYGVVNSAWITLTPPPTGYLIPEDQICEGEDYYVSDVWCEDYDDLYWTTTGDGCFDYSYWLNTKYYPGNSDIQNGYVDLNLELHSWNCSAIGNAQMRIYIDPLPDVFVGEDATIYEDEAWVALSAIAENAEAIEWSSSGDGTFDNAGIVQSTYTPGLDDINSGSVTLFLSALNDCGTTTDSIALTIVGFEKQTIQLNQGWSGISSYLDIRNDEVEQIVAAIEDKLIILRDFEGNAYQPENKNLLNWDFTKAYYLKMASPDTLEITGLYPLSKQLDLQQGWNLIPVLSDQAVNIENHFYGNLDKVEIITEVAGVKVFWPEKEITTLQQLFPGKAYLVKTKAPFALSKLPEVATAPVAEITPFSAISGGEVADEGSSSVTDRGVVWSVSPNPTLAQHDGITSNGTGAGAWVCEVTELLPGRTYFLRAYATNHAGVEYGEELSFSTPFVCGYPFTDPRDNQTYNTVEIGSQCWMKENLNHQVNSSWCYQNNIENCDNYGRLYTWGAALTVCPDGWHLPSFAEWVQLVNFIVAQGFPNYSGDTNGAANALKSCRQVDSPLGDSCSTVDHPRWESYDMQHGFDEFGFSALPGGITAHGSSDDNLGFFGSWWSSTEHEYRSNEARKLKMGLYRGSVSYDGSSSKSYGFSVRCLRD
jgi:uncharacterized protein (TIGR02145 family)